MAHNNIFGIVPQAAFLSIKKQLAGGDGYVTLNTAQTISGQKTFDTNTIFNYDIYVASIHSSFQIITTYVNSDDIYASNSYLFGDGTTQTTAYKSLTPGSYTTANITVDSHGAISAISSGSSSTIAAQVQMTDASDATSYALCFAVGSPDGAKAIRQDYNVLTYIPSTATLSVTNTSIQNVNANYANISGTLDAYLFSANFITGNLISNSTTNNFQISSGPGQTLDFYCNNGGTHNFMCAGTYNQSYIPLRINAVNTYDAQLTIYGHDTYQQIIYNAESSNGSWNPIVPLSAASIVARGTAVDNKSLAITLWSNTSMGLLMTPTSARLRYGNQFITLDGTSVTINSTQPVSITGYSLATNDNSNNLATTAWVQSVLSTQTQTVNFGYANFYDTVTSGSGKLTQLYQSSDTFVVGNTVNGGDMYFQCKTSAGATATPLSLSTSNIVLTSTTCPNMTGYSTVAASDSSTKIATTAWVQSALTNAGIGNTVYVANNNNNAYFGICYADANGNAYKSLYQDPSSLRFNPSINDLTTNTVNSVVILKDANNNLVIGNSTNVSSSYADAVILGESTQSICVQGQINEKCLTINNTTSAPQDYYFSSIIPQIVFLQNYNNNYSQTLYLPPVSFFYQGCRVIFRKSVLYLPYSTVGNWNVTITTANGAAVFCRYDKFINQYDSNYTPQTSFGFGTSYVYVEFICDGEFWYPNSLV